MVILVNNGSEGESAKIVEAVGKLELFRFGIPFSV
jgi:hypothetical protein